MTSGNKIVDKVTELKINSIPDTWYSNIRKNNKPNAMAILMLWDIIYWYKATEKKDEATDRVTGLKKKFKDKDYLQRNYQQLADKYGISKKVATTLTDDLEKIGVIKKHFRTVDINGIKCSNVMFIEVVPSVLKSISSYDGYNPKDIGGIDETGDTTIPEGKSSYDEQGDTNTNNYSDNYPNNYSFSSDTPNPFDDTEDFNNSAPTNKLNTVKSKKVPSSPSPKAKKSSYSKEDYTECRNIITRNRQTLAEKGVPVEKALYDIKFVNSRLKLLFDAFGVDQTKQGLINSPNNKWLIGVGYTMNAILSKSMFPKYIANEQSISNGTVYQPRFQQVFDDKKERTYDNIEEGRF